MRVAYPWDTKKYTPTFTGVPPHGLLMSEMEILMQKTYDLQKGIKSDMQKMFDERGVGGNEFHTNDIISAIEESNNKMLSVMKNVTTSYGNEDVLLKDEECEDLWMIDEGEEVGDTGNEEVHLN